MAIGDNAEEGSRSPWCMDNTQKPHYIAQFSALQSDATKVVSGNVARKFLRDEFNLSNGDLTKIIQLSDLDGDGDLKLPEFCIAIHLASVHKSGTPVPGTLPSCLLPAVTRSVLTDTDDLRSGVQEMKDNEKDSKEVQSETEKKGDTKDQEENSISLPAARGLFRDVGVQTGEGVGVGEGATGGGGGGLGAGAAAGVGAGVGAAAGAAAVPSVVAGLGFTSSGVSAGSFGAWLMSSTAVLNGGAVPAGSVVSVLQSVGAVGVLGSPVGLCLLAGGAAVGAAAVGGVAYAAVKKRNANRDDGSATDN